MTSGTGAVQFYKQLVKHQPEGQSNNRKAFQRAAAVVKIWVCSPVCFYFNSQNISELKRLIHYFTNNGTEHKGRETT